MKNLSRPNFSTWGPRFQHANYIYLLLETSSSCFSVGEFSVRKGRISTNVFHCIVYWFHSGLQQWSDLLRGRSRPLSDKGGGSHWVLAGAQAYLPSEPEPNQRPGTDQAGPTERGPGLTHSTGCTGCRGCRQDSWPAFTMWLMEGPSPSSPIPSPRAHSPPPPSLLPPLSTIAESIVNSLMCERAISNGKENNFLANKRDKQPQIALSTKKAKKKKKYSAGIRPPFVAWQTSLSSLTWQLRP